MQLENLGRAVELQTELKLWRDAEARCNPSVFKEAALRVVDMAHGHQGQAAETTIRFVDSKHLLPFVRYQIERVVGELREIGVQL